MVSPGPWYNLRLQQYQPNAAHGPHAYRLAPAQRPSYWRRLKDLLRRKTKKKDDEPPASPAPPATPAYRRYDVVPREGVDCIAAHYDDSFNGGSCLAIDDEDCGGGVVRLFHCDFELGEGEELVLCVVTKPLPGRRPRGLDVRLRAAGAAGAGGGGGWRGAGAALRAPADAAFRRLQRYLLLHEPDFYVSVENAHGWDVRSAVSANIC